MKHPVRRLVDPFQHRSVQATNDNFKLLFEYNAAEFSLAPLSTNEQLRLIDDSIREHGLSLRTMDMHVWSEDRGMSAYSKALVNGDKDLTQADFKAATAPAFATENTCDRSTSSGYCNRWHYRALKAQKLYGAFVNCWLDANYANDAAIVNDPILQYWWSQMVEKLPALRKTKDEGTPESTQWLGLEGTKATRTTLKNVLSTLMTWLSQIHEDVGHAAAAYVFNPVHTPMCVPEDGFGVPYASFLFNVAAYRGFVFLDRADLTTDVVDPATGEHSEWPPHWFERSDGSKDTGGEQCFTKLQQRFHDLGEHDTAFKECDGSNLVEEKCKHPGNQGYNFADCKRGFYSCVDRMETAVSS